MGDCPPPVPLPVREVPPCLILRGPSKRGFGFTGWPYLEIKGGLTRGKLGKFGNTLLFPVSIEQFAPPTIQ